ncbi:hypothetical protein GCM10025771_20000 [Niveibacterium umoris]|uniref:Dienelactone hydrolase n=1 Tax=Niveibacterium umoris TaxID=1193620 RepID=A0A840BGY3_9RHOO|nr:dienelactone hydrolase family protein [Niveibacterium umoris]MBB4012811.1 dienelactone hydrolase [Niveibacterium umoris]
MLPRALSRILACALLAPAGASLAAMQPKEVSIPAGGNAPALRAFLFEPTGAGAHPAVLMLHGCGGAYARNGELNARHQMWGEALAARGYVALMLDSFSTRGLREICTQKFAERSIHQADRVDDAVRALRWLHAQPGIGGHDVGLIGWSNGGGTVLDTITAPLPGDTGFTAAASFYPGCTPRLEHAHSFHPTAPTLLLIGEADDWTPAAPCVELASLLKARGEPLDLVTYPDTFHDFDNPALKAPHVRSEVPNGVHPGKGVTVAPNPAAREDAMKRVFDFFAMHLK